MRDRSRLVMSVVFVVLSAASMTAGESITLQQVNVLDGVTPSFIETAPNGDIWYADRNHGSLGRAFPPERATKNLLVRNGHPLDMMDLKFSTDGHGWFTWTERSGGAGVSSGVGMIDGEQIKLVEVVKGPICDGNRYVTSSGCGVWADRHKAWFVLSNPGQFGSIDEQGKFDLTPLPSGKTPLQIVKSGPHVDIGLLDGLLRYDLEYKNFSEHPIQSDSTTEPASFSSGVVTPFGDSLFTSSIYGKFYGLTPDEQLYEVAVPGDLWKSTLTARGTVLASQFLVQGLVELDPANRAIDQSGGAGRYLLDLAFGKEGALFVTALAAQEIFCAVQLSKPDGPDLTVELQTDLEAYYVGQSVRMVVIVRNRGNQPSGGDWSVNLQLPAYVVDDGALPSRTLTASAFGASGDAAIPPGAFRSTELTLGTLRPIGSFGPPTVTALLSGGGDTNTFNNRAYEAIEAAEPPAVRSRAIRR